MKYLARSEELVLLTIWKMETEPYGVNIRKQITKISGRYWSIGSIYVPLDRLENKGYLESYLADPTSKRGGKSKRYYRLTKEGLKQLKEIKMLNKVFWEDLPDLTGKKT